MNEEIKAILANINSLAEMLKQNMSSEAETEEEVMDTAGTPPNDDGIYREDEEEIEVGGELKKQEEDEDEEEEVEKSNARDNADKRIEEDLPVQGDVKKALSHLDLALQALDQKNKPVRKSKGINDAISKLTQAVTSMAKIQKDQSDAITGILEGFGIADEVKKAYQPVKKEKPVGNLDAQKFMEFLSAYNTNVQKTNEPAKRFDVRKGLGDVMQAISHNG